jgi:hypothetical protein
MHPQLGHDLLNGSGSAAAVAAGAPPSGIAPVAASRGASPACVLAEALLAEAGGRLWEGKESVLDALAALAKSAPGTYFLHILVQSWVIACQV